VCFHISFFFFSSRRRHTRFSRDWSSDVCSSDLQRRIIIPLLFTSKTPDSRSAPDRPEIGSTAQQRMSDGGRRLRQLLTEQVTGKTPVYCGASLPARGNALRVQQVGAGMHLIWLTENGLRSVSSTASMELFGLDPAKSSLLLSSDCFQL